MIRVFMWNKYCFYRSDIKPQSLHSFISFTARETCIDQYRLVVVADIITVCIAARIKRSDLKWHGVKVRIMSVPTAKSNILPAKNIFLLTFNLPLGSIQFPQWKATNILVFPLEKPPDLSILVLYFHWETHWSPAFLFLNICLRIFSGQEFYRNDRLKNSQKHLYCLAMISVFLSTVNSS